MALSPPRAGSPDESSAGAAARQCSHCHEDGRELRRGMCALCYDQWVRSRPVGIGASCAGCGDRRRAHLRHVELPGSWLVLCHNCTARADALRPSPVRLDDLVRRLQRDRRHPRGAPETASTERRAPSTAPATERDPAA